MGKVAKGVNCSVSGLRNPLVKDLYIAMLSRQAVKSVGERRVFLCHEHFKVWKKATKKDRELDRVRFK